mgnify:CR=1 FL=1
MEVDVVVRHQQSRAERPDQVGFGADGAPCGFEPGVADNLAGALLVGVPFGILTALFMSRFASERIVRLLRPAVSLLAGIPSVVYGFFGLIVIVPLVRMLFGGTGSCMLSACLLLGMMILPTIITVSESALNAVPAAYYEGALALGATHERAVFRVVLPAAKSGVAAAVILGIGRAVGEAMAVMMVAGNRAVMPSSLIAGVRTLTTNIVMEMGYAADLHREALIATGVVLFVFILIINLLFSILKNRREKKQDGCGRMNRLLSRLFRRKEV